MAVQAEIDKVAAVIEVLVNDDGNNNAAIVHALTGLDPSTTANLLTLKAWLAFKVKFTNPYMVTAAQARDRVFGRYRFNGSPTLGNYDWARDYPYSVSLCEER
jgi:hypothetical protein